MMHNYLTFYLCYSYCMLLGIYLPAYHTDSTCPSGEYTYTFEASESDVSAVQRLFQDIMPKRSLSGTYQKGDTKGPILAAKQMELSVFRTKAMHPGWLESIATGVSDLQLGSGQFATVRKAVWHSPFGPLDVAVKTLLPKAPKDDKVKFLREAATVGQFQHPNVVRLWCVARGEPKMMVLELLSNGDLKSYLKSLRLETDANVYHRLLNFCRQIASGMAYLSTKGFIHRDLTARNVLLSREDVCKVGDFGLCRSLANENYNFSRQDKIPVKWTAPEALHYLKYSTASDVWSYGVVMYEIWSLGHQPYKDHTNQKVTELVSTGFRLPPPPGCPRSIYQLMIECWHPQASKRPTFQTILSFLSRSDTEVLQIGAGHAIHPDAFKLGASCHAATELHEDLQKTYYSKK